MKKIFAGVMVLICLFMLSSCKNSKSYLSLDAFGEDFRAEYPELYVNTNCKHKLFYKPAKRVSQDVDANIYHYVYCHWGHCDFDGYFEPHTIEVLKLEPRESVFMKENGYYYHRMATECAYCREQIILYILCERQDRKCYPPDTGCLADADWRALLADLPYVLIDEKPPRDPFGDFLLP